MKLNICRWFDYSPKMNDRMGLTNLSMINFDTILKNVFNNSCSQNRLCNFSHLYIIIWLDF